MPGFRGKLDVLLSTSEFNHSRLNASSSSPISPTGRIAKRNAQLINELNLRSVKRKSTFSEAIVGTVLELESYNLNEKCPIIHKIIDSENNLINAEHLDILQKQLEDLIADNIDNQKRIHGEILYLNTGDYPTDNLNNRLMPSYSLRTKKFLEPKIVTDIVIENNDFELNSSPEEDEENPSVVDIPQRFWNWCREYLRHITAEYVENFKKRIVDRFSKDALYKYVYNANENAKYINENHNLAVKTDKRLKRRLFKTIDDCPLLMKNRPKTDFSNTELRNSDLLLAQAVTSTISNNKSKFKIEKFNKKKTNCNNGFEIEDDDNDYERLNNNNNNNNKKLFNNSLNHHSIDNLSNNYQINELNYNRVVSSSPNKTTINNYKLKNNSNEVDLSTVDILMNLRNLGTILSSYGTERGIISSDFVLKNLFFENKKRVLNFKNDKIEENEILDEVSLEILKKQKELMQLSNVTFPLIESIYERIQSEYVLYETLKRLDYADNKLFELGSKYESVNFFTKDQQQECIKALIARDKALKLFCYKSYKESKLASNSKYVLQSQNFLNNKINSDFYINEFNNEKYTYS